jgi:hypothetical protein
MSQQIHFTVSPTSNISSTTINFSTAEITGVSVQLYEITGGPALPVGAADAAEINLLATAVETVPGSGVWKLTAALTPGNSYFLDIDASVSGAPANATYASNLSVSAVPLPPAAFLLAAALAGLIGFARFGRKTGRV